MGHQHIRKWASRSVTGLSALGCVGGAVCYAMRPDLCAAVTFLPTWVWPGPGLALAALGWWLGGKRAALVVTMLWLVYLGLFAEEARSLTRLRRLPPAGWQQTVRSENAVRVISVNCAGGNIAAGAEARQYAPDILLLQETPQASELERLASNLFGEDAGLAAGLDTAIVARDKITATPQRGKVPYAFNHGQVRLASGITVEVFSVHFLPPVVRFDVWRPSCWREQAQKRRTHRTQMREVADAVAHLPADAPVIVGGDFNVPGGDGVFDVLRPRLRDAFKEGGIGWGNTVLNDMPVMRFDQIWVSEHFHVVALAAREMKYSDHRMVICDVLLCDR